MQLLDGNLTRHMGGEICQCSVLDAGMQAVTDVNADWRLLKTKERLACNVGTHDDVCVLLAWVVWSNEMVVRGVVCAGCVVWPRFWMDL